MKNAYECMKRMVELDNEILELSNKLSKTSNVTERERLSKEVDHRLSESLVLKHKLEDINIIA